MTKYATTNKSQTSQLNGDKKEKIFEFFDYGFFTNTLRPESKKDDEKSTASALELVAVNGANEKLALCFTNSPTIPFH